MPHPRDIPVPLRQVDPAEAWAVAEDAVGDFVDVLARYLARQHHDADERARREAGQP